ncbi:hypothetical protein PTKIN_Ptkin02bG0138800 [Pterospermum kingtungense]
MGTADVEDDEFTSDDDEVFEDDEEDDCLTIPVTRFEKARMRTSWRQTLLIKLIGRTVEDDYSFAKFEGPWMILDHYLIVKEWYPNFDLDMDRMEKVLVGVHFSCLPIEYYD